MKMLSNLPVVGFINILHKKTYGSKKISCTICPLHIPHASCIGKQCFQNAQAYFATVVSYTYKMFKKLIPVFVGGKQDRTGKLLGLGPMLQNFLPL